MPPRGGNERRKKSTAEIKFFDFGIKFNDFEKRFVESDISIATSTNL